MVYLDLRLLFVIEPFPVAVPPDRAVRVQSGPGQVRAARGSHSPHSWIHLQRRRLQVCHHPGEGSFVLEVCVTFDLCPSSLFLCLFMMCMCDLHDFVVA